MILGMRAKLEATFQKLDRLTQMEIRETAAQSLEVLYRLFQSMRVLMDGEQMCYANPRGLLSNLAFRQQGIDERYPRIPRYVLPVK
jgi:hypothetical protein